MAFHIRAAIIAGLAVIATAGYCSWQFSQISQSHLNEVKASSVSQQLMTARAQVELYVDKTANELTSLIEKEMSVSSGANTTAVASPNSIGSIGGNFSPPPASANAPASGLVQSDFVAIAVLGSKANSPWVVDWFQSKNPQFTQSFLDSELIHLPLAMVKGDQVQLARIEFPDRQVYFVLSVQIRFKSPAGEDIKIAVGVLPVTYFSPAFEMAKSSGDEIFLIDASGYAYTYPDQQYVGAKMDVHPIVKRAMRGDVSSDVRESKNLAGQPVTGGFEKLRNSNLTMIMASPILARSQAVVESVVQVAFVSFALVLLTAVFIALLGRRENSQKELLASRIRLLEMRAQTPDELKSFAGDQNRKEGLRDFANGIIQYLRGPLAAVLGQAQLAMSKTKEEEVKTWLSRIEKEARLSRDFIEGLAKSQGLIEVELQKVELEGIVTQALIDLRPIFSKNTIHIEENYKSRARVEVSAAELRQILQHLFHFQVQRLSATTAYRKITLDIEQAGPFLKLKISDSAPAPESDVLRRFFEPFQVEGLNFSLAKNTIEKFRGALSVVKSESGGLEFRFDFPMLEVTAEQATTIEDAKVVVQEMTSDTVSKVSPFALQSQPTQVPTVTATSHVEPPTAPITLKVAKPKMSSETNSRFILNGQPPLEKMEIKDLPPAPQSAATHEAEIKSKIVAEELSVSIRKPKINEEE